MTSTDTYTLIDSGGFRKLEQVGKFLIDRPAPQAAWRKRQPAELWEKADAYYERNSTGQGTWDFRRKVPESWTIQMHGLTLKIKLTDFGHIGFFPEHAMNWLWIKKKIMARKNPPTLLNMFAYTGGASLAAAAAGANVTHLDASRGIVNWARENAAGSGLKEMPIRWIVDDVIKFCYREIKRGSRYDAVILDPPSYGRGNRGEVWKFEEEIVKLLDISRDLLTDDPFFVLLSAHTPGFSPTALSNLLEDMMAGRPGKLESSEMYVHEAHGKRKLPSGIMARWEAADG